MSCSYIHINKSADEGSAMHLLIFEVGGEISSVT